MKAPYWGNYNLYKVLQVENFASPEDIKKSYRRLALRHHPDRNGGKEEMAKLVNLARDVLAQHRNEYDNWLKMALGLPLQAEVTVIKMWERAGATATNWTFSWG